MDLSTPLLLVMARFQVILSLCKDGVVDKNNPNSLFTLEKMTEHDKTYCRGTHVYVEGGRRYCFSKSQDKSQGVTAHLKCKGDYTSVPVIEGKPIPIKPRDKVCGCKDNFDMVCGIDGKEYPNPCQAKCQETTVACKGKCPCDNTVEDCECKDNFDMVCGIDGKDYPNPCQAKCQETTVACKGKCPCDSEGCTCTDNFDPVCGVNKITYPNPCEAVCKGTSVDCKGSCPCSKQTSPAPPRDVGSCKTDKGNECKFPFTYEGKTFTKCTTYNTDLWCPTKLGSMGSFIKDEWDYCGEGCTDGCACTERLDLVCGLDKKEYPNPCEAECKGTLIECKGPCPCQPSSCGCSAYDWNPVCGSDGLTYINPCKAKCDNIQLLCQGTCPCESSSNGNTTKPGSCMSQKGIACMFPFTYEGKTFTKCTSFRKDPWCPTRLGRKGSVIKGEWEYCGAGCKDGCACTDSLDLVCGMDRKEYPNPCEAECKGTLIECKGSCPCKTSSCGCSASDWNPVCGSDGLTYINPCKAKCDNIEVLCQGTCPCVDGPTTPTTTAIQGGCECEDTFDPVCGVNGENYPNPCEALCKGTAISCNGPCPCNPRMKPRATGSCMTTKGDECMFPFTYEGKTFTKCTTYSEDPWCPTRLGTKRNVLEWEFCEEECADGCSCSDSLDFVCGTDEMEYPNPCEAECKGAVIECKGQCPCKKNSCGCSASDWNPVCGSDGLTYINPCTARCENVAVLCQGTCPCGTSGLGNSTRPGSCQTKKGDACMFPFTFEGKTFTKCTTFFAKPWCPTRLERMGMVIEGEWGFCGAGCEDGCTCPKFLDIVCGVDGEEYPNPCEAECQGTMIECKGQCPCQKGSCGCSAYDWNPVCGSDGLTYINPCKARCDNIQVLCEGTCPCIDGPITPRPEVCKTESGRNCLFPFSYDRRIFIKCTFYNSEKPWCPTKLDEEGTVIEGFWEDCGAGCVNDRNGNILNECPPLSQPGPYGTWIDCQQFITQMASINQKCTFSCSANQNVLDRQTELRVPNLIATCQVNGAWSYQKEGGETLGPWYDSNHPYCPATCPDPNEAFKCAGCTYSCSLNNLIIMDPVYIQDIECTLQCSGMEDATPRHPLQCSQSGRWIDKNSGAEASDGFPNMPGLCTGELEGEEERSDIMAHPPTQCKMLPVLDGYGDWVDCKQFKDMGVPNGHKCRYKCNPVKILGADANVPMIIPDLIATCKFGKWEYKDDGGRELGHLYDKQHPYCPGSGCYTTMGSMCVFPFKYKGHVHTTCTAHHGRERAWCATQVDKGGNMVDEQRGDCSQGCTWGCHCTKEEHPVCGVDGQTYGNPCLAECAGTVLHCSGSCPCPAGKNCGCSAEDWSPVCGEDGLTYINYCTANCENMVNIVCDGACPCHGKEKPKPSGVCKTEMGPCVFPFKYKGRTYTKCTDFESTNGEHWCATKVDSQGIAVDNTWADCQDGCLKGCDCNNVFDRVCGFDGTEYPNPCTAECHGADIKCKGKCPCDTYKSCGCSAKDWSPVCGNDGFTYINECKARCDQTPIVCKGACPCSRSNGKRLKDQDKKDEFAGKGASKGCRCGKVFDPVCGVDGTSYPNPCTAKCHEAVIDCKGKCPCEFDDKDNKECRCGQVFDPVCGVDGTSYPNSCTAKCHEAVIDCKGKCPCDFDDTDNKECRCGKVFDPVCGVDGTSYPNPCTAKCNEAVIDCKGKCPCEFVDEDNKECRCGKVFDPVCGVDGTSYPNPCTAKCHEAVIDCKGKCPCEFDNEDKKECRCGKVFDPVCGVDGTSYPNPCTAKCREAVIDCKGKCPCEFDDEDNKECNCGKVFDPVCGVDGTSYPNPCTAKCHEAVIDCKGKCPCEFDDDDFVGRVGNTGCNCGKVFDPICGVDGTSYPNPCTAECHGAGIECEGKCPCEFDDEDEFDDREDRGVNIMTPAPGKCKSTNGEPCVFPFRYRQHYYTKCTKDYSDDGMHWCATQVDEKGMMEKQGKCAEGCNTGCSCTDELDRVCGFNGVSYPNPCEADCAGALIKCKGKCPCHDYSSCGCSASDYSPVCGEDGFTYINRCKAECDKVDVLCQGSCPCKERPDGGTNEIQDGSIEERDCKTTRGKDCVFPFQHSGHIFTRCTEYELDGPWCATQVDGQGLMLPDMWGRCGKSCGQACKCTKVLDRVCGFNGKEYPNPCLAECAGSPIKCKGKCPCKNYDTCECPTNEWAPVCGDDGFTYITECKARCDKTKIVCKGACPCKNGQGQGEGGLYGGNDDIKKIEGGPPEGDGGHYNGTNSYGCRTKQGKSCVFPFTYKGHTYTKCTKKHDSSEPWCATKVDARGNVIGESIGDCDDGCLLGCDCPSKGEEVCGFDGKSYDTGCHAECEGQKIDCKGPCPCKTVSCSCSADDWSPVCADDGLTYINSCKAECENADVVCKGACPCLQFKKRKSEKIDIFKPNNQGCKTKGGEMCVFPFTYDDHTYTRCTDKHDSRLPWCATKVDSKGTVVGTHYGDCAEGCPAGCDCPKTGEKVCGFDGSEYPSGCHADCEGMQIDCKGSCPCTGSCKCSAADWSPVCGKDGLTYINECKAKCEKTSVLCKGNCPCQLVKGGAESEARHELATGLELDEDETDSEESSYDSEPQEYDD